MVDLTMCGLEKFYIEWIISATTTTLSSQNWIPTTAKDCISSKWIDLKVVTEDALLRVYFLAMSSIFEPERVAERYGWAKTQIMIQAVSFYFKAIPIQQKKDFIEEGLH